MSARMRTWREASQEWALSGREFKEARCLLCRQKLQLHDCMTMISDVLNIENYGFRGAFAQLSRPASN